MRLKKVLVIHAASFISQIMMIVRPLIKSDLLSLLQFTTQGPLDVFTSDLIPEVCFMQNLNYLLTTCYFRITVVY